jgi:insulysin
LSDEFSFISSLVATELTGNLAETIAKMIITGEVETLETPTRSPSDRKDYKFVKLPNGMKVLIVKNAASEKSLDDDTTAKDSGSAVALCIDVGSFEDPQEVQGLCHFLEHMVRV